jgi:hypothetical protein
MRLVVRVSRIGVSASDREHDSGSLRPLSSDRAPVATVPRLTGRSVRIAGRPAAPFLAQLIATRQGIAQTRARRRISAGDAIGAYRSIAASGPRVVRRAWGRSV